MQSSNHWFMKVLGWGSALSVVAFAVLVGTSHAGDSHVRSVAWEEFRDRCAHPEQYDVQRAPQNIKIQCTDRKLTWVAVNPSSMGLPTQHQVSSAVFSDKFVVDNSQRAFDSADRPASCHRYKEVEEFFTMERSVSCEEVISLKGDVGDYCNSLLERAKGSHPKLVEQRDTLRVLDTCARAEIAKGSFVVLQ